MRWKEIRRRLLAAFVQLDGREVYLLRRQGFTITIRLIVESLEHKRLLEQIDTMDDLICNEEPELYNSHIFDYEIWEAAEWAIQPVTKLLERQTGD